MIIKSSVDKATQPLWIENPKVVKRTESPKSSRQAVILSEAKNLAL